MHSTNIPESVAKATRARFAPRVATIGCSFNCRIRVPWPEGRSHMTTFLSLPTVTIRLEFPGTGRTASTSPWWDCMVAPDEGLRSANDGMSCSFSMLAGSEGVTRSIAWTAIWHPVEMTAISAKRAVERRCCMVLSREKKTPLKLPLRGPYGID